MTQTREAVMRGALALLIAALCVSCAEPAPPVAIVAAAPAPAPEPTLSDCRSFAVTAMDAGVARRATGTACLQPDGLWLIVEENPPPAAAIAWAAPVPAEAEQDSTTYYAFDPRNHRASWFDGVCCSSDWGGGGGRGGRSGSSSRHHHRGGRSHAFGGVPGSGF